MGPQMEHVAVVYRAGTFSSTVGVTLCRWLKETLEPMLVPWLFCGTACRRAKAIVNGLERETQSTLA